MHRVLSLLKITLFPFYLIWRLTFVPFRNVSRRIHCRFRSTQTPLLPFTMAQPQRKLVNPSRSTKPFDPRCLLAEIRSKVSPTTHLVVQIQTDLPMDVYRLWRRSDEQRCGKSSLYTFVKRPSHRWLRSVQWSCLSRQTKGKLPCESWPICNVTLFFCRCRVFWRIPFHPSRQQRYEGWLNRAVAFYFTTNPRTVYQENNGIHRYRWNTTTHDRHYPVHHWKANASLSMRTFWKVCTNWIQPILSSRRRIIRILAAEIDFSNLHFFSIRHSLIMSSAS